MMRALYTAASGMRAQQTNVDNISNNIANVNTTDLNPRRQSLNHCYIRPFRPERQVQMVRKNRSERRWDLEQELRPTPQAIRRGAARG